MSQNKLFIFDPNTNSAVCIGKGYVALAVWEKTGGYPAKEGE